MYGMLSIKPPAGGTTIPMYLATAVAFAFFAFSMWHARRQGLRYVFIILAGCLFGFTLEYQAVTSTDDYHYGPFPLMILGKVPAMIVVSWGGLVYGVMRTSDALRLKWYLRPIYDGLLAMLIDLSLDPISIALGFWVWTMPHKHWFGEPFSNYIGWYSMVFAFSLTVRALFHRLDPTKSSKLWAVVLPLITVPLALIPFGLLMKGYLLLAGQFAEPLVFSAFLGGFAVLILRYFPSLPRDAWLDVSAIAAPVFFGAFEFFMLYTSGFFQAEPLWKQDADFVILVPLVSILAMICFCWPFLDHIGHKLRPARALTYDGEGRRPAPSSTSVPEPLSLRDRTREEPAEV